MSNVIKAVALLAAAGAGYIAYKIAPKLIEGNKVRLPRFLIASSITLSVKFNGALIYCTQLCI